MYCRNLLIREPITYLRTAPPTLTPNPRVNHNDTRHASHPNPRADRTNARYTHNSDLRAQCIILSGDLALSGLQRYQQLSYPARHHIWLSRDDFRLHMGFITSRHPQLYPHSMEDSCPPPFLRGVVILDA